MKMSRATMRSHFYSEYLGLYIVVEAEGDRAKKVEITHEKPACKAGGSRIIKSIKEYLATGRDDFSRYDVCLDGMTPFQRSVLEAIRRIPAGKTMTYGEVAKMVGRPGAARAVGNVMAANPLPLVIPCHRVVASTGLGGYSGGVEVKRKLLRLEGAKKSG
jgi:methylated-DNA-[protein]-cysteine S-methyltransferase